MRMTRAQAAALAAQEAGADDDDDNNNNRNGSTTPTDELPTKEREVLGELTPNLDGEGGQSTVQDEEQEMDDEAAESRDGGGDEGENKMDGIEDKEEDAASSSATPAPAEKPNHIPIHQDDSLKLPRQDLDAASPTTELPLLNIAPQRTPANKVMKNDFVHMRSTSNKENMVPDSPVVAGPVDRLQTHVEHLGADQDQPQTPTDAQHNQQPQAGHEDGKAADDEPEKTQTDEAQDDSLIGHFEALHVSPKKSLKFLDAGAEPEIRPGAEQSPFEQPPKTQETPSTNGTTDQVQQEASNHVNKEAPKSDKPQVEQKLHSQDKPKAPAPASPAAKKPSSQTSQSDNTKLARKPSVRQSTANRQSSVVRKSMAPRPDPSTNPAIKRTTSVKRSSVRPSIAPRAGSSQSAERGPADIPHSKPRPMSMSFPTPPPPPKSSKAPTQATFQLGGEAVAARLKAEKEERLKRQAERGAAAKPTYKPPPPPKSTKAPTKATFQLPGEAVAAKLKAEKEERLKRLEAEGPAAKKTTFVPPVTAKSTKPVTKATFQLSSDAFAAKMKLQKEERLKRAQAEEEKKEKEKHVFKARPAPKIKEPALVRQTAASRARLPSNETATGGLKRATSVRESTTTTASKRQSAFLPSASTSSSTLPPRASTSFQKRQSTVPFVSKGKEVFGRAAEKKDKEEKEKREKEEAAKKARAEAAEKGRQASREWAARRKSKSAAAPAAPAAV